MRKILRYFFICLGLSLSLFPALASAAASHTNVLEGQPAIRHRQELRKNRFEIGLSTGFSINRFLRHAILIGAKLEYHFLDYLSLGGDFGYGVSGLDTGIKSELEQQYTSSGESATWNDDLSKRIPDLQFAGDVRLSLTPFTGKFSLFSKWFFDYDMFVFAGLGLAKNKLPSGGNVSDDVKAATEDGLRLGPAFGFGAHIFINSFFSIGLEFKDLIYADNQSGGDLTRGRSSAELELAKSTNSSYPILVDGDDKNFLNHFFFGLNFTFYLPPTVEISR